MSVLELRGLSVTYGRTVAVAPFTETVASGEWLGLIGPNGAGKSSVLRAVVGLVGSTGDVLVDGEVLSARSSRRRSQLIAYVPQEPLIPDDMTGAEYVLLGRSPYVGYFSSPTRHDRESVAGVLERLDLGPFARRRLGTLSGRALAQDAPILLLDEPTSALDIGHQQQALELVARLRAEHGLTVVSAMHDLTLAGLYSDRLALLHAGLRVAAGPAAEVLQAGTLAEFYGARVDVRQETDGTVVVIPRRAV
jgi:iron complex transport system ATP-binding protein